MQQSVRVVRMTAPAYVLLGMGLGFLIGFGAGEFEEPMQPEPMTREEIYAQHIPMADERLKRDDETCLYTSLNGRERGVPFTVVIPAGVTCLQIVGATK